MHRIPTAILFALLALPAQAQFGPSGPPAVGVVAAERRPVTESTEFTGRIEAVNRVDIRARVTGFLQERAFQEGQEVRAGERAVPDRARRPSRRRWSRRGPMSPPPRRQLENARVALPARAGAAADRRRDAGRAGQRPGAGAHGERRSCSAPRRRCGSTEINLGYTDIVSPIDGKIGRAYLTPGNVVSPTLTEPLATVVSQDPMRVAFTVSARAAGELRNRYEGARRRGGGAWCGSACRPASVYPQPGRIDFVDTQIDRNTDTPPGPRPDPEPAARRRCRPAQPGDRELIDGQFVTVSVEGAEPVQAIVLPRAAVLQDQGGNYVLVVDAREHARSAARCASAAPSTTEVVVEDGLQGGETVIVEGCSGCAPASR